MSQDERSIDRARVAELLELYGGDPEQFPEGEREAAQTLLAEDAQLAALQREAAALDGLLNAYEPGPPSAALSRVVAEIPLRHAQNEAATGLLELLGLGRGGLLRAGLAGALAGGLGIALAITTAPIDEGASATTGVQSEPETGSGPQADLSDDEAWDDFAALAFADDLTFERLDDGEQAP